MILLDRQLLKQADFEIELAKHNFFNLKCGKCIDTNLMEKRSCILLYGYGIVGCKLMDNFIEKKTEEINKKIIKKGVATLLDLV